LRERSNNFKIKRNELAEIRAESGIMQNTLDILKNKDKEITETLIALEEQKGISGYFSMQENCLNKVNDDNKSQTADELNDILKKLTDQISQKKTILAPIIKDLRPLRQKCQDLQSEYEQRKQSYDAVAAGLESNLLKFENDIKILNKDITAMESNQYLIQCQLEVMNARQQLLDEEMKLFVSQEPEDKQKSILYEIIEYFDHLFITFKCLLTFI
jgi:intraflagellar transport protein 81